MSNLLLFSIEIVICYIFMLILIKKEDINGINMYIITAIITTIIFNQKSFILFDFDVNLGIIPYITIFTSFNIIIQKKGMEIARQSVLLVLLTSIISMILLYLSSFLNDSSINLFVNASYDNLFLEIIRMYLALIISLLYSILINNKIYFYLKMMKNNIIVSNLFAIILSQFVASALYVVIQELFIGDIIKIAELIMTRYILSLIIGFLGIIPIFISKQIKSS